MGILKKIRQKPEKTRKTILWTVVITAGIVLLFFWWNSFQQGTEGFSLKKLKEGFNLPSFKMEELFKANGEKEQ